MLNAKVKFLYLLILAVNLAFAGTTSVVVQNGTNEYAGCEDSHNWAETPDQNFSDQIEILTFNCAS